MLWEGISYLSPVYEEEKFLLFLKKHQTFHPSFYAFVETRNLSFPIENETIRMWLLHADSQGYLRGLTNLSTLAYQCKQMIRQYKQVCMNIPQLTFDVKEHILCEYL